LSFTKERTETCPISFKTFTLVPGGFTRTWWRLSLEQVCPNHRPHPNNHRWIRPIRQSSRIPTNPPSKHPCKNVKTSDPIFIKVLINCVVTFPTPPAHFRPLPVILANRLAARHAPHKLLHAARVGFFVANLAPGAVHAKLANPTQHRATVATLSVAFLVVALTVAPTAFFVTGHRAIKAFESWRFVKHKREYFRPTCSR
jgi:hypothetical protein